VRRACATTQEARREKLDASPAPHCGVAGRSFNEMARDLLRIPEDAGAYLELSEELSELSNQQGIAEVSRVSA